MLLFLLYFDQINAAMVIMRLILKPLKILQTPNFCLSWL